MSRIFELNTVYVKSNEFTIFDIIANNFIT